jgi:hypothetical protein
MSLPEEKDYSQFEDDEDAVRDSAAISEECALSVDSVLDIVLRMNADNKMLKGYKFRQIGNEVYVDMVFI